MEALQQLFVNIFGDTVWLAIFIFAMLPITEARTAIPFGLSVLFWKELALSPFLALLCGTIGSFLPSLIIVPLLKPTLNYLKTTRLFEKFARKLESFAHKKSEKIDPTSSERKKYILLMLFVAIPLPLTGVWTGSLIASMLNMSTWRSWLAILLGNIIAGSLLTIISLAFGERSDIFVMILFGIILAYLAYKLLLLIIKQIKNRKYRPIIY